MAAAGLNGPFLALWWDESGALVATVRSADSLPVESFTLRDGKQTELILIRRGAMIYAYAVESGIVDPLIAVDFAFAPGLSVGVMLGKDHSGPPPAISPVVSTSTLTGDVLPKQPGAELTGSWSLEEDPGSLGGSHLINRGDDAEASAAVRLENLMPGTHELWIRHAAAESRTEEVEVTVHGFAKPVSLLVNQRISGGIWLPLGRFDTDSAVSATIRLKSARSGSGSISFDAVHEVWSAWKDENKDQLPDVLAVANGLKSRTDGSMEPVSAGPSALEEFRNGTSSPLEAAQGTIADDGKAVFYVHAALGNDSFDGRSGKPQDGAWFSVRKGPKKTIGAALKSVSKSAKVIELHLDGKVGPPLGGFQDLGNVSVILVPGKNGASMESSSSPDFIPQPSPPVIPPSPGLR